MNRNERRSFGRKGIPENLKRLPNGEFGMCEYCGQRKELRPYGKNGEEICVKCASQAENITATVVRMVFYKFPKASIAQKKESVLKILDGMEKGFEEFLAKENEDHAKENI